MHHTEWQGQAADPYDLNAYKKQFAEEHPLEGYLKDVEAGMPRFAGESDGRPEIGDVKKFIGTDGETYTGKWDGKGWVKQ